LHLANFLAAAVSEPALYRLLAFQVPNRMSLFHCLNRTEVSVQGRGTYLYFVPKPVFTVRSQRLAQPPSWRTTPYRLSLLFLQYICSYSPYWRSFIHPQPDDSPCRDDSIHTVHKGKSASHLTPTSST
jgi:hypothetical protein